MMFKNELVRSSRHPYILYLHEQSIVFLSKKHNYNFVQFQVVKPRSSFSSYEHHELHEQRGLIW